MVEGRLLSVLHEKNKNKDKKQRLRVTAQNYYLIAGSLCSILTNISLKVEQNVCC